VSHSNQTPAQRPAPLRIGALVFDGVDQIDLTGPFEVFARLSDSSYRCYGKTTAPVRDVHGLVLHPDADLDAAGELDVLHVPGGRGQEQLMDDAEVLGWITRHAERARCVFSVCTGALLLGAAGLLRGRRATTHWASVPLLPLFGATVVEQRVVVDGRFVFAGGVTAGIDGALRVAATLRGSEEAQRIQLAMQYAPEPPFQAGAPDTAPAAVLGAVRAELAPITRRREQTARRIGACLGTT
jgi:cyclohexyl-isocyanide hydratase